MEPQMTDENNQSTIDAIAMEIQELTRQLEEVRRLREQAERRGLEERRRREDAERLLQPLALQQYLEECHTLDLAIKVVTDPTLTTQGSTTNPSGRIFPRRIIPWNDFATRQEEIWDRLSTSSAYFLPAFPCRHQLEYVRLHLQPVSSEIGLHFFERDVVGKPVRELVDQAYGDPVLRSTLGLQGTVTFDIANHGLSDNDLASDPKNRRKARGKGNRADQFCIRRISDGQGSPVLAIEYKAPHKLRVEEIVTGLESEIWPERDVINKDGQGFVFMSRALAAAVVTQLFSYMIGKGIQYGYMCTGEAFVFLHIPDDPSTVYYSVCIPSLDVMGDDETRLHRTAAAQVFAFTLQALRASPPPASWHDAAAELDTWAVEYEDILSKIPISERKRKEPRPLPYKPQRWKGFTRSPIRTSSRCQPPYTEVDHPEDDGDDPPSPSPNPPSAAGRTVPGPSSSGRKRRRLEEEQQGQATNPNIQSRPFCTHRCLLGLAYGGPMDENCPNTNYHGHKHIDKDTFLRLIRDQLATDRGPDADCAPLHRSGARGTLYKVRLSTHGYTLVAKGVEAMDLGCLEHENKIYDQLQSIQGKHIPVCLGTIDLVRPYYYDSGVYTDFLFLSWAGRPIFTCREQINKPDVCKAVAAIFKAMHELDVLHCDAEPRNILYDDGIVMAVDFERSEFRSRRPLGSIGVNGQGRGRKPKAWHKAKDDFAAELEHVVGSVSKCL
ncbi:hypothetical protein B0T21DRAFT_379291 [Apiosordaria backusii]|uniref:Protein kinase domain-containing protein n=1 Tax=Apiosordaria backusii TaxID=314023 RepID=A0AA39ZPA7_9PEZI|nr:hypothetical protein B0T21DRAFT_379291 [Apiosordaria backusii]